MGAVTFFLMVPCYTTIRDSRTLKQNATERLLLPRHTTNLRSHCTPLLHTRVRVASLSTEKERLLLAYLSMTLTFCRDSTLTGPARDRTMNRSRYMTSSFLLVMMPLLTVSQTLFFFIWMGVTGSTSSSPLA